MTHEELQRSVTESMDAMEARIMVALDAQSLRISTAEHTVNQHTRGINTRMELLERERTTYGHQLTAMNAKLDELGAIVPAIQDLKDLFRIWTREHRDAGFL